MTRQVMSRVSAFGLGLVVFALFAYGVLGGDDRERICQQGFSKSLRPPFEVTNDIKKRMMHDAGIPLSQIHEWRLDHICPLELDCAPLDPANLQLQKLADSDAKDLRENQVRHDYCAGRLSLKEARAQFKRD